MQAPIAAKIPKELTIHGHTRIDNYYWLNQRGEKEVEEYLNSENSYSEFVMSDTKVLQEQLFTEITGRIKQTDMSVPYKENGYFYYTRYNEGEEYPIFCRKRESLEATEEIVLNVNILAEGYTYYQVSGYSVSQDNSMLVFGVDTTGQKIYTLHFKNLITGEIFDESIENTTGGGTWAADNQTIFYAVKEEQTLRPNCIYRYKLDGSKKQNLVYTETDKTYRTYVYKSRSKKFIIIGSYANMSDEFRLLPANNPEGEFTLFYPRMKGHEYAIGHFGNKFYIRTNNKAENFCLMETPEDKTSIENWKMVIDHRSDVLLESFTPFSKYLVLEERIKGISQIRIIDNEGNDHYINFNEDAFSAWISVNPEFDTDILRIGFTSMTTPTSTFDYHLKTREFKLLKRQEVIGGYNPEDYQSERIYAKADDNLDVPISLVYKKGTQIDGKAPLLLYAYGAYGHTMDPYFSSTRLSLLDRGFIFAIAHVRGGQEMGRHWYDNGKLLKKMNTFTDYIACAEFLIDKKYTSPKGLFTMGGSAGGLLVGAVINMKPWLFKGALAAVPFVDVVTTMLDESIPLTTGEFDEWGNPKEKVYYDYIHSYSPIDNITMQNYPNILVLTGYSDSQVQYWEPAKWVAKLRELKTDQNLLLMHINMDAGHSGASGRFEQYRETAMEYAFMIKVLGL